MSSNQIEEVLDPKLFIKYEHHMTKSLITNAVLKRIKKNNVKICDVGGASGVVLNSIIKNSKYKIEGYILDIFPEYKKSLVNNNINYIIGSIIDNRIKSNNYDFVILRDVLHHLITGGLKDIQESQQKALNEMVRITKKGGFIIFEEEINNSVISTRLLYYLSKLAYIFKIGKLGFNSGRVVVSFMTKKEIENVLAQNYKQIIIEKRKYIRWHFSRLWEATGLMKHIYRSFYIIKKI